MILTPTTFIIGAGASTPYRLPVATQVHKIAKQLEPQTDLFQLILQTPVDVNQLTDFLEDLRRHPAWSIDAYLESRPKYPRIGKTVIAAILGDAISKAGHPTASEDQDWLRWLFEKMRVGAKTCDEFAVRNSGVRFVTFNFDNVIEDRITQDLTALYPDGNVSAAKTSFPVIHVHGKFPQVPKAPLKCDQFEQYPAEWIQWIKNASSTINVTLDEIDPTALAEAQAAVTNSKILCFLGFAYDPENLKRLNLPTALGTTLRLPDMFGSAYGLRSGEQATIRGRLHNKIELGSIEHTCLDVLRDFHIFRD